MHENPHYGITVSKKANLYVSLTILDKDPVIYNFYNILLLFIYLKIKKKL